MRALIQTDHKEELFKAGAQAAGFEVVANLENPEPGDILMVWNTKNRYLPIMQLFKTAGAKVVVTENGYIGSDGEGKRLLAMSLDAHAGRGKWNIGQERRYLKQNFMIHDWREPGEEVIILAQRGIGEARDSAWAHSMGRELGRHTRRKIIVRDHPGKNHSSDPIEKALDNAYCAVTWSSGAGIKALAYGVPVLYFMPGWIGGRAAAFGPQFENLYRGERETLFHAVGWAQWEQEEVRSGAALRALL